MGPIAGRRQLRQVLELIERADKAERYDVRNRAVMEAAGLAASVGYPVGIRLDPAEPAWPVVYIELPTGQVSWHLPQHEQPWDGHSTPQKYARCQEYCAESEGA